MADNLQKNTNSNYKTDKYIKYIKEIQKVIEDFEIRFQDFDKIKEIVEFVSFPFKKDLNIKHICQKLFEVLCIGQKELENEIITLQTDVKLIYRSLHIMWRIF